MKTDIISAEVKAAFLQGRQLDRKFFHTPTISKSWRHVVVTSESSLWSDGWIKVILFGVKGKVEIIGMKVLSSDSALFTMHEKWKLIGLVFIHVDDIFITGNKTFKEIITTKLTKLFQFSKVEERKFKYYYQGSKRCCKTGWKSKPGSHHTELHPPRTKRRLKNKTILWCKL